MKSLERIKLEVFATEIWTEHEDLDEVINEVAKRYAKEVAREALKNASSHFDEKTSLGQISINVITSESNIPKL